MSDPQKAVQLHIDTLENTSHLYRTVDTDAVHNTVDTETEQLTLMQNIVDTDAVHNIADTDAEQLTLMPCTMTPSCTLILLPLLVPS